MTQCGLSVTDSYPGNMWFYDVRVAKGVMTPTQIDSLRIFANQSRNFHRALQPNVTKMDLIPLFFRSINQYNVAAFTIFTHN